MKHSRQFVRFFLLIAILAMGLGLAAFADAPAVPAGTAPADGGTAATAPQQTPGFAATIVPFLAMFGVVYLLMIRPQQKRVKEQQALLSTLKQGDEVVTTSGLLGKVTGITEKVVTLEVADNVRVKMLKSQVSQVIKGQVKDLA